MLIMPEQIKKQTVRFALVLIVTWKLRIELWMKTKLFFSFCLFAPFQFTSGHMLGLQINWAIHCQATKKSHPDPRSHIDPIGTLLIPLIMIFGSAGFSIIGWGKPVQISLPNPKTRKRDDILITLAGPFSNLAIALICTIFFGMIHKFYPLGESILLLYYQIVTLNAVLFLFNLIPIPPLDGSHLLKNAIRMREETFLKFSKYGFLLLIVLVNIQPFQLAMSSGITQLNSIFFGIFSLLHS